MGRRDSGTDRSGYIQKLEVPLIALTKNDLYMCGCCLAFHQGNPLHMAARQGDMDALKRLVNKGTDVNSKDDDGVSI